MSGNAVEDLDWYRQRLKEAEPPTSPIEPPDLQPPGGGDNYGGMDSGRLDRLEADFRDLRSDMREVRKDVSNLHLWLIGTTVTTIGVLAALQIGLWTYSANINSTALTAIQTVLAARPAEAPPPPHVIIMPPYSASQPPAPIPSPPKSQP